MSREVILNKAIEMFSTMTDIEEINEDSELIGDLEISSMDVLVLICSMEVEFNVKIPEKAIRKMATIGDVVDVILTLKK